MRLQLQGIQVRPDRYTVGTNGHWLAIVSPDPNSPAESDFPTVPGFPEAEASAASPAPFLMPSNVAADIFKALPKRAKVTHPVLAFARVDAAENRAVVTDLETPKQFSWKADDRRFPDFEKVVDKEAGRFSVRLSVEYLEAICKAARECNEGKLVGLTLSVRDSQAQVHLQAGRFFAVLMPLRDSQEGKKVNCIEYPAVLKMETPPAEVPEAEPDSPAEAEASPNSPPAEKASRKRAKAAEKVAAEKVAAEKVAAEQSRMDSEAAARAAREAAMIADQNRMEAGEKARAAARMEAEAAEKAARLAEADRAIAARKAELEAARAENRRLRAAREKAEAEKAAELAARYDRERIAREAELAAENSRRLAAAEAFEASKRAEAEKAARIAAAAEAELFAEKAAARLAELAALTSRPRCPDCTLLARPYCDHMELARA